MFCCPNADVTVMMNDLLQEFEQLLHSFFENNGCKTFIKQCTHERDNNYCDYSVFVIPKKIKPLDSKDRSANKDNVTSDKVDIASLIPKLKDEAATWKLKLRDLQTSKDQIFIYLDRGILFYKCFNYVLQLGEDYGTSTSYLGKTVLVSTNLKHKSPMILTELRVVLTKQILEEVFRAAGATVINDYQGEYFDEHVELSCVPFKPETKNPSVEGYTFLLIAPVVRPGPITPKEYTDYKKGYLQAQNENVSCVLKDEEWESLAEATVLFDLLKSKINKEVKLTSFADNGAVFTLYNYVRFRKIIDVFEERSESGIYPKLPQLEEIDFSCLTHQEEWRMIFDHVLAWPKILANIIPSFKGNCEGRSCGIHTLLNFLWSLSLCIGSYYSKIQILTKPREKLLPSLFCRIYLVKVVLIVMSNCFKILGIKPLYRM